MTWLILVYIYMGVVIGLKTFDPPIISLSDETLKRGSMTIFNDNLLTRTCNDEAGNGILSNALIPRELVFKPSYWT